MSPLRNDEHNRNRDRDRGSILPMVLAFMVIGSMIVLPLLSYASTVLRANSVPVARTENRELVRGGTRVALSDPASLFNLCDGGPKVVPTPSESTTTTCQQVSEVGVIDALEIPYGATAIQMGESVPAAFNGSKPPAPAVASEAWWDPIDAADPAIDTIWMPNLPEVAATVQEAGGYPMPSPYDCRVYFPGRYSSPIVLTGRTYFASGSYYFAEPLTVVGGADVVVGYGLAEGCVGDLEAVLDMPPNPLPTRLNVDGLGATFVFGDKGRLIVDDSVVYDSATSTFAPNTSNKPLRLQFNQRYVEDEGEPGARVSIMSVNGDVDIPTTPPTTPVIGALDVPGVIHMPLSMVETSGAGLVPANTKNFAPSVLTAEPRPPKPPTGVTVTPLRDPAGPPGSKGAARVSWAAPTGNDEGGSTITNYLVTVDGATACETDGATTCVVRGLSFGVTYQFAVTARNSAGPSSASANVAGKPMGSSPTLSVPAPPTAVTVAQPDLYLDQAEVSWSPPMNDGNGAIVEYVVTAYRLYLDVSAAEQREPVGGCVSRSFRNDPVAMSCVVTGLPALDTTPGMGPGGGQFLGYRFGVSAVSATTNLGLPANPPAPATVIGTSPDAPMTGPPIPAFTGAGSAVISTPVWPVAGTYVPDPIVDVKLTGGGASSVAVAGYVAVPQGRVRVLNPAGRAVGLDGGLVAGSFDVDAASLTQPTTDVGFRNTVLQRTIVLTTEGAGNSRSTMQIQVNANGADYRINYWVTQ